MSDRESEILELPNTCKLVMLKSMATGTKTPFIKLLPLLNPFIQNGRVRPGESQLAITKKHIGCNSNLHSLSSLAMIQICLKSILRLRLAI
jgi:hypothetical protein